MESKYTMNECPITKSLNGTGNLLLRLTLAVAIWPHGAQKVLGLFGGDGYTATYTAFTQGMGIWGPLAFVAIMTEFLAPVFLVFGLLTRFAALFLAILMSVALGVHASNGFFINWGAIPGRGEGIEYHILFIGTCLALVLLGAGKYSLDRVFMHKICSKRNTYTTAG